MDEILKLVNAGFTADEIKAMTGIKKPETPKEPEKEPEKEPPQNDDIFKQIFERLDTLTASVQAANRRQGFEPEQEQDAAEIFASIFNKKKGE